MWKAVGHPDTNRNGQDIKTITSMAKGKRDIQGLLKVKYDHTPARTT